MSVSGQEEAEKKVEKKTAEGKETEAGDMEPYWMWLCCVPELSQRSIQALVSYFGSPKAVYEAAESEFEPWKRMELKWVNAFLRFRRSREIRQVCHSAAGKGINFISRENPDFPGRLKALPDCPAGLFYRGRLPKEEVFSAAVVGARQCSGYGRIMAQEISGALAEAGAQIISGLALGIDGIAQRAALQAGGCSFGVLGSGADVCYPKENFPLYQELLREGGVLSEFPPGSSPAAYHFPMRNRIISGLADVVVVVEAREHSGSLITADLALDQGKDVYAVPGRSTDPLSAGCNRLIEQGAGVICSIDGFLKSLGLTERGGENFSKKQLSLAPEEELVYSNLDLLPKGLGEIAEKTALPIGSLAAVLLRLQLKGAAAEVSKNQYAKLRI